MATLQPHPKGPESGPEIVETQAAESVQTNSRLYYEYAGEFSENRNNVQDRFQSLGEYLRYCLDEAEKKFKGDSSARAPMGCESAQDLLKPYWETKKINGASVGSLLALEHGLSFLNARKSGLAHHVFQRINEMRKNPKLKNKVSATDFVFTSVEGWHRDFESFLAELKKKLESGEIQTGHIPGFENFTQDDMLRPLNEAEITYWFDAKYNELLEDAKEEVKKENLTLEQKENKAIETANNRYRALGYDDFYKLYFPEIPEISNQALEADEDSQQRFNLSAQDSAQRDWFSGGRYEKPVRKKVEPVYTLPVDGSKVEVPPDVEAKFYKTNDKKGPEIRGGILRPNFRSFQINEELGILRAEFDGVEEKKGVVFTKPGLSVEVYLPVWIINTWAKNGNLAIEAVKKIIENNQGSSFVRAGFDISANCAIFGFGQRDRPSKTLAVTEQEMERIFSGQTSRVSEYFRLRRRDFEDRDFDSTQNMWAFERDLLANGKIEPDAEDGYLKSIKRISLRQYVWDKALRDALKAELGQDEYERLNRDFGAEKKVSVKSGGKKRIESGFRPAESFAPASSFGQRDVGNQDWEYGRKVETEEKWGADPNFGGDLKKQHQARHFIVDIKSAYADPKNQKQENKLTFLANHPIIKQYADKWGLSNQELAAVLAEDILNRPGLEERYAEFKVIMLWGAQKIIDICKVEKTGKKGQDTKAAILVHLLGEVLNNPNQPLIPKKFMPTQGQAETKKTLNPETGQQDFAEILKQDPDLDIPKLSQLTGLQGKELAEYLYQAAAKAGYGRELSGVVDEFRQENGKYPPLDNLLEAVKIACKEPLPKKAGVKKEEDPRVVEKTKPEAPEKEQAEAQETTKKIKLFRFSGTRQGTKDNRTIEIMVDGKAERKVPVKEFLSKGTEEEWGMKVLILSMVERLSVQKELSEEDKKQLAAAHSWLDKFLG